METVKISPIENQNPRVKFWYPQYSNISLDAQIGKGTTIHSHVWIADNVIVGENCRIEAFAFLPGGVILEDNVFIGPHVCFTNDRKPPSDKWDTITVQNGAKIGANASILAGVTIGEDALVGMGSVVLKDVPAGEVWAGNPAKFIKKL
jgi:acetyltransferase-like isoleucine patch superfamily enzyme